MNAARIGIAVVILGTSLCVCMSAALAQRADPQPAVQTSPDAAAVAVRSAGAPPVDAVAVQSAGVPPANAAAADNAHPRAQPQPQPRPANSHKAANPGAAAADSVDSIELSTTEISGNRELPKLMYVVPWRRDQLGKFVGRPPNSLVDEALMPVDRAVFDRQNRYYAALQAGVQSAKSQPATTGAAAAASAPKDEK